MYFKKNDQFWLWGVPRGSSWDPHGLSANELKDVINKLIVKNKETVDAFCHTMRWERGYTRKAKIKLIWNRNTPKYAVQLGLSLFAFSLSHTSFGFWKLTAKFHGNSNRSSCRALRRKMCLEECSHSDIIKESQTLQSF